MIEVVVSENGRVVDRLQFDVDTLVANGGDVVAVHRGAMNRPNRKIERDRHLPLIGYNEIEAGKRELARALFVEGENETSRRLLELLRTYKIVDEPLPYLAFRGDADDRQAMMQRSDIVSAGIPPRAELHKSWPYRRQPTSRAPGSTSYRRQEPASMRRTSFRTARNVSVS